MKVKIIKSCAGRNFSYSFGQIVSADDTGVRDIMKAGFAIPVKSVEIEKATVKPTEKAVALPREEYEVMTKNELVMMLARTDIEFNKRQTKAELIDLLLGGDR